MKNPLELLFFTTDVTLARSAERAGVNAFIVDWESKGKSERQYGHDMEINADTPEDVRNMSASLSSPVIVRINAMGPDTAAEIEQALDCGARGLMLPMATSVEEVHKFLEIVKERARTIVQIETQPLVEEVEELAKLPWDNAYIGLHDLMLSRQASSMWEAVIDGTVENIFTSLQGRAVGFAGATVIGGGHPIRFTMILQELARLNASLTFLRRSFRREIRGRKLTSELASLRAAWTACQARNPEAIEIDRAALWSKLERLVQE